MGTSTLSDIVDHAVEAATKQMATGKLDLRHVIYMAVQQGMADAYERGIKVGEAK